MQNPLVSDAKKSGSFCDQLRYLIVLGTTGFRRGGLTGKQVTDQQTPRSKNAYFVGTFLLKGADSCFLYGDPEGVWDRQYVCAYGDSTTLSPAEMSNRFAELDRDVGSCLEGSPWPGYFDRRDGSHIRYSRSDSSTSDFADYLDAGFIGPSGTEILQSVSILKSQGAAERSSPIEKRLIEDKLPKFQAKTVLVIVEGGEE